MARPRLPIDTESVITAYQRGDSLESIARTLGVDRSRVTRVVDEAGLRKGVASGLRRKPMPGMVDSEELIRRAGITYRQLNYWTTQGVLTPVGQPNPGTGITRYFPTSQVWRAATLRLLLESGMTLTGATAVVDDLTTIGAARIGPLTLRVEATC